MYNIQKAKLEQERLARQGEQDQEANNNPNAPIGNHHLAHLINIAGGPGGGIPHHLMPGNREIDPNNPNVIIVRVGVSTTTSDKYMPVI